MFWIFNGSRAVIIKVIQMHPVITEICCCFCIKNDDDLQSRKLQSVVAVRTLLLLHCLLVMVSDLKLKSYTLESCKIIYSLIDDNSKFETDAILIIILYIKNTYVALCFSFCCLIKMQWLCYNNPHNRYHLSLMYMLLSTNVKIHH